METFNTVRVVTSDQVAATCVSLTRYASRPRLLLGQVDGGGLGSDGDAVLVQHFNQNLSDVFVVRVKVEDVAHHVGQTLVGEFLLGGVKERDTQGEFVTGRPVRGSMRCCATG